MSDPLVSIVTPCYRQARFLPETIQSVQDQTYGRIEMIVVNDGSDDDTDAVMERCGSGVIYVKQANAGVSAARNRGIAKASGQYFMFLDADDLLDPSAIHHLIEAMEGRQDRLCVMGYRMFDSDPNHGEERLPTPGIQALPRLFSDNLGPPHAFLCSKQMLDSTGGFETDRLVWSCEDWDLWLRMALHGCDLAMVNTIGAFYRRYEGSVSTNPERTERATAQVLQRAIRYIENDPQLTRQWSGELKKIRRRIAQAYLDVGYHRARRGAALAAIEAYRQSARWGIPFSTAIPGMIKAMAHAARARVATPSPLPVARV